MTGPYVPVRTAAESLAWIADHATDAGDHATRRQTLSLLWAEARYALEHLHPAEEHLRGTLAEMEVLCRPTREQVAMTRVELGRQLRDVAQLAEDAVRPRRCADCGIDLEPHEGLSGPVVCDGCLDSMRVSGELGSE